MCRNVSLTTEKKLLQNDESKNSSISDPWLTGSLLAGKFNVIVFIYWFTSLG